MRKILVLAFVLVGVLTFGMTSVFAGSASINGTIDTSNPTMAVVFITTPNCTGQGVTPVLYEAIPFTVDADGAYTIDVTSDGGYASMYIYENSFDPANGMLNCIAGDNSGNPVSVTESLTAGTSYFLVVFDDTFAQVGGNYSASFSGPGNISIGSEGACTNPLPAGSVVYELPAGAPAFFAPNLESQTGFAIPAGTWWITQFSGDFAQVWIACQANLVWVPTNAVLR